MSDQHQDDWEGDDIKHTSFAAPASLIKRLDQISKAEKRSRSQQIVMILEEWIKSYDKKKTGR